MYRHTVKGQKITSQPPYPAKGTTASITTQRRNQNLHSNIKSKNGRGVWQGGKAEITWQVLPELQQKPPEGLQALTP